MGSTAYDDWIEEARSASLVEFARDREPRLKSSAREIVGPCPACGGTDRFSINLRKNIWHCRKAELGGDVIALVEYVDRVDFLGAVEILTGRPAPGRESGETPEARAAREEAARERRRVAAAEEAARAKNEAAFRQAEIARARKIWDRAMPIAGTDGAAYFAIRHLVPPIGAHLRFAPALPYYVVRRREDGSYKPVELFKGPAVVAGITGPDDRFTGVHLTWIDLADADGKARIVDPETGEMLPAKKVRGSVHGARIELVRHPAPVQLFLGEGNETSLSAYQGLQRLGSPILRPDAAVWSGVSLGNMSGRALDRLRHPNQVQMGRDGRERPVFVAGPTPNPIDAAIPIPPSVTELWLLGDGDSDPFATEAALQRSAARLARDGLTIRAAWAEPDTDFNIMLRRAAA